MAYRTLLAHFPFEDGMEDVLDVATTLAERHRAHLTGLHVIPRLDLQYSYEIPVAVTREFEIRRRALAVRLGKRFEAATAAVDFVAEWRLVEDVDTPVERVVTELGNTADLIVAGQARDTAQRGERWELTARVLGATGRPLLLVPPERRSRSVEERVFVAWDGQRAATRALFGALPMLVRAESVRLQRINAPERNRHRALGSTEMLADTLSRHGVDVELFHSDARESEVGVELLRFAEDWGADLIVSGGEGAGGAARVPVRQHDAAPARADTHTAVDEQLIASPRPSPHRFGEHS